MSEAPATDASTPTSHAVVTVSFPPTGDQGDYATDGRSTLPAGALVVVEGLRGLSLGRVIREPHVPKGSKQGGRVRRVVREASAEDRAAHEAFAARETEALRQGLRYLREKKLPWKIVRVFSDGIARKFTLCFAAEERLEAREDARELGRRLGCHVELRQVGQRDAARVQGGLGRCGRELCCSTFLPEYPKVNIRNAKQQGMALVADKTNGVCGRTLCCLSYEDDFYKEQQQWLPRVSKRATTTEGLAGRVIGVDVFRLTFTLLDESRRRHVLPAASWVGNEGREVPSPPVKPASAVELVSIPSRRPPSPPASAAPPAPKPPRSRPRRRRRRLKKGPE